MIVLPIRAHPTRTHKPITKPSTLGVCHPPQRLEPSTPHRFLSWSSRFLSTPQVSHSLCGRWQTPRDPQPSTPQVSLLEQQHRQVAVEVRRLEEFVRGAENSIIVAHNAVSSSRCDVLITTAPPGLGVRRHTRRRAKNRICPCAHNYCPPRSRRTSPYAASGLVVEGR